MAEEVRELSHLMVKIIWRPYYQKRVEGKRSKKREPLQPKKERLKKVSWFMTALLKLAVWHQTFYWSICTFIHSFLI